MPACQARKGMWVTPLKFPMCASWFGCIRRITHGAGYMIPNLYALSPPLLCSADVVLHPWCCMLGINDGHQACCSMHALQRQAMSGCPPSPGMCRTRWRRCWLLITRHRCVRVRPSEHTVDCSGTRGGSSGWLDVGPQENGDGIFGQRRDTVDGHK